MPGAVLQNLRLAARPLLAFPWPALAIAALIATLTASAGDVPAGSGPHPHRYTDRTLYRAITARVQAGQDYYVAAAAEQRAHAYPTKPAVALREPIEAWLLAALQVDWARWAVLLALAAFVTLALQRALEGQGLSLPWRTAGVALAATGLANAGTPQAPYLHEVWAALLICGSLALWRPGRYAASIALALGACLFREIAAPVLLAMCVCAGFERRWREVFAWCAAAAVFGVLALIHLWLASRQAQPGDLSSPGWAVVGGWRFIVATGRRNLALALLPAWAVSVAMALALIGLARVEGAWWRRVAAVTMAFVVLFWFVGRPDNYYWGILYAPLAPLGLMWLPKLARELLAPSAWTRPARSAA